MENDDGWKHDKIKKIFKLFKEGNVNEWKLLQSAKEKFRKENSEERTQEGWLIIVKRKEWPNYQCLRTETEGEKKISQIIMRKWWEII